MAPSEVVNARAATPYAAGLTPGGTKTGKLDLRCIPNDTPRQKKNMLVERSIYQRQRLPAKHSPASTNATMSTAEYKSADLKRQTLKLRPGAPADVEKPKQSDTQTRSPSMLGWLKVRDGDEKATISRIWEALGLPDAERRYAWNAIKNDKAAQKAYGGRLRIALNLKKEFTDFVAQRQAAISNFTILLNERPSKANVSMRKCVAETMLQIRSLTSKITWIMERVRHNCKLPLILPHFTTEKIDPSNSDSWYARLLTENLLTKDVLTKLMLLVGFFDDPENNDFANYSVVQEAVSTFYYKAVQYGVWVSPSEDELEKSKTGAEQTGTFAEEDVSLFILLGLPIITLQNMDFVTLPEMLSQFLETASGVPEMPLTGDEIKYLLISEGKRLTTFRTRMSEIAAMKKDIAIIPVLCTEDNGQYELYSAGAVSPDSIGLFSKYYTPADGSVMPKKEQSRRQSMPL